MHAPAYQLRGVMAAQVIPDQDQAHRRQRVRSPPTRPPRPRSSPNLANGAPAPAGPNGGNAARIVANSAFNQGCSTALGAWSTGSRAQFPRGGTEQRQQLRRAAPDVFVRLAGRFSFGLPGRVLAGGRGSAWLKAH